jgi:hypothetical protein
MGCGGDDDVGTAGSGGSSGSATDAGTGGKDGGAAGSSSGAGGLSGASGGSAGATDDAGDASLDRSGEASDEASADVPGAESAPDHDDLVSQEGGQADAPDESMSDGQDSALSSDAPTGDVDVPDSEAGEASLQDADAAAPRPKICAEQCTTDDDCARDTGIQKFRCHPATHHCASCIDDMICIASRSLWTGKPCTVDSACVNDGGFAPFGDVCIDIGGSGYCAFLATSTTNCASFLNTATFSTFTVKKYGSDDAVDVCGKPSRCDADRGSCQNPCTSNTSCTPAKGGKTCNTGLGRCECASDGDCGPGAPTCNLDIKQCECGSQADCSADTGRTLTCQ